MTAIVGRQVANNTLSAYKSTDYNRKGRYMYERFSTRQPLVLRTASTIAALPTAAQGQTDYLLTPAGNYIEYFQSTAQTLQPIGAAQGLVLDGDQVDNETQEYVFGGIDANSPLAFVTGTDNFFMRATLEITDASGSDQLIVGFRKAEAFQVPVSFLTTGDALYTDFFGIGFAATKANPNTVAVATDLANAGSTTVTQTGFTWADTLKHKLEVRCVGRVASFLINGIPLGRPVAVDALGAAITSQATKVATYTAAAATTFVPFIFVRQDADLLDAVYLREIEIGALSEIGEDPSRRGNQ